MIKTLDTRRIYGDTDSLMVLCPGKTDEEADRYTHDWKIVGDVHVLLQTP
jgi:DNA polymerase elongation subunit (family B)